MLSTGVYTIPEAARLARMKPDQVRRCISGYSTDHTKYPPLWKTMISSPQTNKNYNFLEIGFADLIELRYVREFLNHGVKFRTLRLCMYNAQRQLKIERPFVSQKLQTDGKTIFLKSIEGDEEAMTDLKQLQIVLHDVLRPTFLNLEYDAEEVVRWWPLHNKRSIVIDPAVAFGRPIASESGVPTETIVSAVKAEGSITRVSKLYDVDESTVRDALCFEDSLKIK